MSFHSFIAFDATCQLLSDSAVEDQLQSQQSSVDAVSLAQHLLSGAKALTAAQRLMSGVCISALTWALICEKPLSELDEASAAAECGMVLLAADNFRDLENCHLMTPRVRFIQVPCGEQAMLKRINWMCHAGSNSPDLALAGRASEAVDIMIGQLAPDGSFDPESLAERLSFFESEHPEIVAGLFMGDLDDVPDLIDVAVRGGADEQELVAAAAGMFVCWGALEQQREACLGWRLIHRPLEGKWGHDVIKSWTIGQVFRPKTEQHAFAHEMVELCNANQGAGIVRVEDKRTINRIERTLKSMGYGEINRKTEQEVISGFGLRGIAILPALLSYVADEADWYHQQYRLIMTGPNSKSRSGQRADLLSARISAVHRTAIVCARTHHLASLAPTAQGTDDLRSMLDAHRPDVLRPAADRREDRDKFRLRQLFHVVRIEFLLDGEHVPKKMKSRNAADVVLPLDLDVTERLRGHEIFDRCWVEINDQPAGWRFMTPLGWQCDSMPRLRLRAPQE